MYICSHLSSLCLLLFLGPDDYIGGTFTVIFSNAAVDVQCLSIVILSDLVPEPDGESFLVHVSLPLTGLTQRGSPGQTIVRILGETTFCLTM